MPVQIAGYAAGTNRRVAVLCVLDCSPKNHVPFPIEDGLMVKALSRSATAFKSAERSLRYSAMTWVASPSRCTLPRQPSMVAARMMRRLFSNADGQMMRLVFASRQSGRQMAPKPRCSLQLGVTRSHSSFKLLDAGCIPRRIPHAMSGAMNARRILLRITFGCRSTARARESIELWVPSVRSCSSSMSTDDSLHELRSR